MANEQLQNTINSLTERKRRRKRITRIGWITASACALVVLVCLMVPALTMEHNKYVCGLDEHTHTDQCVTNTLVCEFPTEKAHVHTPSCYDMKGNLTCKQDEAGHIHLASCYDKKGKLICDTEETVHMHNASCYNSKGELTCNSEALHVHGENCYVVTTVSAKSSSSSSNSETAKASSKSESADSSKAKDDDDEKSAKDDESSSDAKSAKDDDSENKKSTETVMNEQPQKQEIVLACTEDSVGHIHLDTCYDENGKLICEEEEVIEIPHEHSDSCYKEEIVCDIEEHTHDDSCVGDEAQNLVENEEEKQAEGISEDASTDGDATDQDSSDQEAVAANDDEAQPDLTKKEIEEAEDQGLFYENKYMMVAFTVPDDIKDSVKLKVTETDEEVVPYTEQDLSEFAETSLEAGKAEAEADGESGADDAASTDESVEGEANDAASTDESVDATDKSADSGSSSDQDTNAKADNTNAAQAKAKESDEKPAYQVNLHVDATLNDEPVEDIASLGITAKLQMKSKVISPILKDINYKEVAPEIKDEVGAEITVIQQPLAPANAMLSELPDAQIDEVVATSAKNAATTFNLVTSNFTAKATETTNAHFTVEYKAPVETPLLGASGQLKVIDTQDNLDGVVENDNKLTPTNDADPKTQWLTLENGKVKMDTEPKPIYKSKSFEYYQAPTLNHINTVKDTSYTLTKVTVTTDGVSTDYGPDIHFTNRPESEGYNEDNKVTYALIKDNKTVITLTYTPKTSTPSFESSFYDYDITDGYIYNSENGARNQNENNRRVTSLQGLDNWAYTRYANTLKKGINSDSNYSKSGTKLAFGNVNTGTGLGNVKWKNQLLNMYNHGTYEGCTFGLVTGLENGVIQYASGVSAPNLFNEGSAAGKTTYNDGKLTFNKLGDTYTLSSASVGGNTVSGLNVFGHPGNYTNIWTNNFWPLDNTDSYGTDNHDLKFGSSGLASKRKFVGESQDFEAKNGKSGSKPGSANFPLSDDSIDHNSYFGLNYEVEFTLDEDYIGPLEYLFFGDDDLWIFLDGNLVVDIGGVHSSVGEYVNLWDYLKKGSSGKHILSIFYTERGASGSTCYMNFTLPSVTGATIDQKTGSLMVQKEVSAPEGSSALTNDEFEFSITLNDSKGNKLVDDYSYTRYKEDGDAIESNLIVWDGGSFKLKNGEYIIIKHLPLNAQYTIQEVLGENEPYTVTWDYFVDKAQQEKLQTKDIPVMPGESPVFTGIIGDSTTEYKVKFINTVPYELPDTGGIGTYWFLIGGGALMIFSVGTLVWRRRISVKVAR